jgi:Wings apart-like protein regulation of heterochromatin
LRATGESKRFTDDMGYLLEGLKLSEPIGIRRSGAVELSRHLADAEFVRKLCANGLVGHVYEELRRAQAGDGDRVRESLQAARSQHSLKTEALGILRC